MPSDEAVPFPRHPRAGRRGRRRVRRGAALRRSRRARRTPGAPRARGLGPVDLDDWSGIVVGGGPWNVSDPQHEKAAEQIRGEARLRDLALQVLDADFPFLGACYGIGTLGTLRGGVVDRTYGEPIGPMTIDLTDEGRADPLVGGCRTPSPPARAQGGRVTPSGRRRAAGVVGHLPGPGLPDRRERLRDPVPPRARPAGDRHPDRGLRAPRLLRAAPRPTRSSSGRATRSSPSRRGSSSASSHCSPARRAAADAGTGVAWVLTTRQRTQGTDIKGRAKEAAGSITGDDEMKNEGRADQARPRSRRPARRPRTRSATSRTPSRSS